MKLKEALETVDAKALYVADEAIYDKEYETGFASDLMSDALAMLKNEDDTVLLITGLANIQALRTAEMLDLQTILFVRGKEIEDYIIDEAKDLDINIFRTEYTMYQTSGKLYSAGLKR